MPAAFDRCIRKVKARGGARNPFAAMGSDAEIKRKSKKKRKHRAKS